MAAKNGLARCSATSPRIISKKFRRPKGLVRGKFLFTFLKEQRNLCREPRVDFLLHRYLHFANNTSVSFLGYEIHAAFRALYRFTVNATGQCFTNTKFRSDVLGLHNLLNVKKKSQSNHSSKNF